MKVFRLVIVELFLGAAISMPVTAQDFTKVEIKTEQLSDTVYMLTGAGGNMGVSAGEDGIFLIDDQFAPLTEKIKSAISKINKGDIRFVLNTHLHGDHTGGNENMGKAGSVIVAHDNVRKRLSMEKFNEFTQSKVPPSPKDALPVVTFADALTFHLNGEEIHAFHIRPAHTDGDSMVHFRGSNVLHMGDLFFNGKYPYIDLNNGGSLDGVIAAVEQALEIVQDDTKIIPGHGPLGTRKDLIAYHKMLKDVRGKMMKLIKKGKSLEDVLAKKPFSSYDKKWGEGFIKPKKFITILYKDLSR